MYRSIQIRGIVFAAIAVILGAFGAHALKALLPLDRLQVFETGVRYQIIHAIALIVLSLAMANAKKYEHFFAADSLRGIRSNVLYIKTRIGHIGVFYGYAGGGAYGDGYFWIDNTDSVMIEHDIDEFPDEVKSLLEFMWSEKSDYEDHSSVEGEPSSLALSLRANKNTVTSQDRWVYCTSGCSRSVIKVLSQEWSLSVHW